jgi:uncharacterized protein
VTMSRFEGIFGTRRPLIAMCHLAALPGRPNHDVAAGMEAVFQSARRDALALQRCGVDAILFCNENDLPYSLGVGVEAAAAEAAVIGRLVAELTVPFGVDLLWDPAAALAVARATGARFVREVFTGVFETDMGLMAPDFGSLAAYRHVIGADDVAIFTNITPEFSRSVSGRPVADRARGAEFLGADAILISGPQAGMSIDVTDLAEARAAAPEAKLIANTGVNRDNVHELLAVADGVIVGTSLKVDGNTWNPVDPARAEEMVKLVRAAQSG